MKAIVYQSNAGHSKRYAELFSQQTGLPVYDLKEANKTLSKGTEIIFFSWICAGSIPNYAKTAKRYQISALCAVGMGHPGDNQIVELAKKYQIELTNAFYLQGGFDFQKLHGIYKFMMKSVSKFMGPALEKKSDQTADEIAMLNMLKNGGDYVSIDNLLPILNWYKASHP